MSTKSCVFCAIIAGDSPATIVERWDDAIAIYPRNGGVRQGSHILIIPNRHVVDMREDEDATALVAKYGARLANQLGWPDNQYATNCGEWGGQTVPHLHGHLLEAGMDMQYTMPWFGQQLRDGRRFFAGGNAYGDLTLWTGDEDRPVPVATKDQLDAMDPILWGLLERVLEPTHLGGVR